VENSDWIGSHLQVRYLCGRVDVVVILVQSDAVHEMLCRPRANEFDNRMLQVKNQLRGSACGLVRSFPLLYSNFISEENYGQTNADSPTAGHQRRAK
jgi:hypothetical protein